MERIEAVRKYGFMWWKYLFKIPIPYIKIKLKWYNIKVPILPDEKSILIHKNWVKVKEKSKRKAIIQEKINKAITNIKNRRVENGKTLYRL